jgi:hypothetical protein
MPNALARRSDRDRFGLLGTQERHRPSIRTYRDASLGAQRMANPSWIRQSVPTKPYVPRRVRAAADASLTTTRSTEPCRLGSKLGATRGGLL